MNLQDTTRYIYSLNTYICRVQSSVWRLPKYWPPPHPLSTQRRGGGWKTPDIGLASYSMIPLRIYSDLRAGQDAKRRSILLLVSESLPAIRSISKLKKQILKIKQQNFFFRFTKVSSFHFTSSYMVLQRFSTNCLVSSICFVISESIQYLWMARLSRCRIIWFPIPHPLPTSPVCPATHRKTEQERQPADGRGEGEGGGEGVKSYKGENACPLYIVQYSLCHI